MLSLFPPSDPSVYRVRCLALALRDLLLDLITSEDTSLTCLRLA